MNLRLYLLEYQNQADLKFLKADLYVDPMRPQILGVLPQKILDLAHLVH